MTHLAPTPSLQKLIPSMPFPNFPYISPRSITELSRVPGTSGLKNQLLRMMFLVVISAFIMVLVAREVAAVPVAVGYCTNMTATTNVLGIRSALINLTSLDLPKRHDETNGTTIAAPKIDGSAGTYLDGTAWAAIIAGAVSCMILVCCICWCGRRRNW